MRAIAASFIVILFTAESGSFSPTVLAQESRIEFNRDVRPILSDKCFRCHGPDSASRAAELRLDVRDDALVKQAIVPGKPLDSELIRRITVEDDSERMPPLKSGKTLSAREIDVLRRWVQQGAEYQPHWAFVKPRAVAPPAVKNEGWVRNPIDRFVLAELERRGLSPAVEADDATLRRRAALVLTGLPFDERVMVASASKTPSYEEAVDQLLTSPRYAERMTLDWLDAARYADTNGYFRDFPRHAWPWRDWVLKAFAQNMPFDQFTIEQLAGDLLPDATLPQCIATGFNRNHMVTDESGVIDEEYRVSYVADRVETTATVWLGLTLGCARCHDHKYDPLSQTDYFRLFAYFNNVPETGLIKGTENPPPVISLPTAEQERQLAALKDERAQCEQRLKAIEPALLETQEQWLKTAALPQAPRAGLVAHLDFNDETADRSPRGWPVKTIGEIKFTPGMTGSAGTFDATQYLEFDGPKLETAKPFALSVWIKPGSAPIGYVISKMDHSAAQRGFEVLWYKAQPRLNFVRTWRREAIELAATDTFSSSEWHHLTVSYDGSGTASSFTVLVDGQPQRMQVKRETLTKPGTPASELPSVTNDASWQVAWKGSGLGYDGQLDELRLYDRELTQTEAMDIYWHDVLSGSAVRPQADQTAQQKELVRSFFLKTAASNEAREITTELTRVRQREAALRRSVVSAAVMREMDQPRETFILTRGQYDQPSTKVTAGVPQALGALLSDAPPNRLALARWLVSEDNPLTARVVVNRLWQQVFGEGLVRTVNDFGLQGELPSHPQLLDWLAVEFVRSGWDMRHMLRLMVTSATFRQSSRTSELDPENRWLSHFPHVRLPAEVIRDQALAVSGLLVEQTGGPSVRPYQPPGLWEAVSYNSDQVYEQDHGPNLYRRSLYTFWKRQAPPPDMLTFDGPTRETCTVRRPRTNTPLQALVLLNDVTYVEAARALATRTLLHSESTDAGTTTAARVAWCFERVTGRVPDEAELATISQLYERQLAAFRQRPNDARKLLTVGELPVDASLDPSELASWTVVVSTLLNLDETLTLH